MGKIYGMDKRYNHSENEKTSQALWEEKQVYTPENNPGRLYSIDKSAIRGKHAKLKQILAYYSDTITHIIFSFLGIIALVVFFGESARCALKYALSLRDFSCYYYLAQNAPNVSSLVLSFSFILFAFTRLNILLSGLTFAFNTLRYAFFSNRESIMSYNPLYYMLFSFLFFIFVVRPVGGLVLYSGLLLSKCFIG